MPSTTAFWVDSTRYVFAYLIRTSEDLPADFPIPDSANGFEIGLFLPRDDPDWFGRSTDPPRILLVHDGNLLVLTHPAYSSEPQSMSIADLAFVETGHILLIGWLRFVQAGVEIHLPFNTRSQRPVEEFLDFVMNIYLGAGAETGDGQVAEFGGPLDIKFRNQLSAALRKQERLRARWFNPPSETVRRWSPIRLRSDLPGDLIAITNTRVLWIRDRREGAYERYGAVTSTVPLRCVRRVRCRDLGTARHLEIALTSGLSWLVPLSSHSSSGAEALAETLTAECPLAPKVSACEDPRRRITQSRI
jgi:hypothetical protein